MTAEHIKKRGINQLSTVKITIIKIAIPMNDTPCLFFFECALQSLVAP